ncbi:DUF2461 domain-containing protein [Pedobacter alluvionis]|uniref:DUF2461 domain-containing protein n=1 Tax=Pedobacter alluvionis TaxID=475253 RepID=A0A497Y2V8_9SPHI|nr:DUF2461 domain-containing protein [Pedobacter alluvionis]RLJ77213.1 uncharacterized protein (TIGR02453 family) [Pedobacter alluvionis]TFB33559.1 DUF2461 domain-containing protein [Pedobacter alluvionis]
MLKKETLNFIKDVAENNNREWFAANKDVYEAAKADVLELVAKLIPELAKVDPLLSADADPKKSLLRIYRDVRFSKNKDPYKNNFGIWFSAKSKGGNEPGYYLHIQPGKSFIAGGYWMPEASHLKLIRQEIDYNIGDFKEIINGKDFKKNFKLGVDNALKNAPKGYDPADPNIEFLKLKSFEATTKIDDEEFLKPNLVNKLISSFKTVQPLVAFLRNAIEQ